jgi:hypothetical protein
LLVQAALIQDLIALTFPENPNEFKVYRKPNPKHYAMLKVKTPEVLVTKFTFTAENWL